MQLTSDRVLCPCLLVSLAISIACGGPQPQAETAPSGESPITGAVADLDHDVHLERIAPDVWQLTALAPASSAYASTPANGLVIEAGDHAVVVDPGWSPDQGSALLAWVERDLGRHVSSVVVTHFHEDRLGGAAPFVARNIPVFGTRQTIALATLRSLTPPTHVLDERGIPEVRWFHPGAGHSPDNIVIWHEGTRVLFGGCFVKALDAHDLGNIGDADVAVWPSSIDRTLEAFPSVQIVVPGHGARGDVSLLHHTRELAVQQASR